MTARKAVFIETIGCQMNVYDTERIAEGLRALGYATASSPEKADLIIANTCSVREKAEQKAFSFLGRLNRLKKSNPRLIIGVGGCVAQQEGRRIRRRVPHVDLVFGTAAVDRVPAAVAKIEKNRCRIVDVAMHDGAAAPPRRCDTPMEGGVSRFVTIMRGCENYCTYCIVPLVRGPEKSRPPAAVIQEVKDLVRCGAAEVTLLGQNVNSYGRKEGLPAFSDLLEQVNAVDGLLRIRFTTSHPKDLTDELAACFGRLEKLCRHIHLPVQSGSDDVLRRMNRRYTRARYLERIALLRRICPDIAVTSDVIVGFPGETEAAFADTMDLVRQVRFDNLFAFKYSDRPGTRAAGYGNKVPEDVKSERLERLLNLQAEMTREKNENKTGAVLPVLVEGKNRKPPRTASAAVSSAGEWTGRTTCNRIVHFAGPEGVRPAGVVDVRIDKALAHSLRGRVVENAVHHHPAKGKKCHAA